MYRSIPRPSEAEDSNLSGDPRETGSGQFIGVQETESAFLSPYGLKTLESIFRLRLSKQDGYKVES